MPVNGTIWVPLNKPPVVRGNLCCDNDLRDHREDKAVDPRDGLRVAAGKTGTDSRGYEP